MSAPACLLQSYLEPKQAKSWCGKFSELVFLRLQKLTDEDLKACDREVLRTVLIDLDSVLTRFLKPEDVSQPCQPASLPASRLGTCFEPVLLLLVLSAGCQDSGASGTEHCAALPHIKGTPRCGHVKSLSIAHY